MSETRSVDVILASMLHAAYFLHYFRGSGWRGPRRSDRKFLRDRIGDHAERLIGRYGSFPGNASATRGYIESVAEFSAETRELLLMKLANELEDCLDAAPAYSLPGDGDLGDAHLGADCAALAEAVGRGGLASDLREAFASRGRAAVPASLERHEHGSYGITTQLWKANVVERLGAALRRYRASR